MEIRALKWINASEFEGIAFSELCCRNLEIYPFLYHRYTGKTRRWAKVLHSQCVCLLITASTTSPHPNVRVTSLSRPEILSSWTWVFTSMGLYQLLPTVSLWGPAKITRLVCRVWIVSIFSSETERLHVYDNTWIPRKYIKIILYSLSNVIQSKLMFNMLFVCVSISQYLLQNEELILWMMYYSYSWSWNLVN